MGSAYNPAAWHEFYLGMAEASLGLIGLTLVVYTVHMSRLGMKRIPTHKRTLSLSLLLLVAVFFGSAMLLIPDQSRSAIAIEILILAFVTATVLLLTAFTDAEQVELFRGSSNTISTPSILVCELFVGIAFALTIVASVGLLTDSLDPMYLLCAVVLTLIGVALASVWINLWSGEELEVYAHNIRKLLAIRGFMILRIERREIVDFRLSDALDELTGGTILVASDIERARDIAKQEEPNVVLFAAGIKDKTGEEMLSVLCRSKDFDHIPIIVVDSSPSVRSLVRSMKMGAFAYLAEPIDVYRLLYLLGKAISPRDIDRLR